MENICTFCESNKTVLKENILSPLNNKQYCLYECRNCLIQFILPNVFEDVYTDGISTNESMNDYVKELHKGRTMIEPPTAEVIKQIRKHKIDINNKKILDIGAGDGINYVWLKNTFNLESENYHVLECDKNSIKICKQRGIKNIYDFYFSTDNVNKLPNDFDVVIFTEVFEHQTEPADFLKALQSVIKKDGVVILTVPNRKMLKTSRKVFYADIPPHHFLRMDTRFFKKNFQNFEKLTVSTYPNPFVVLDKERAAKKISAVIFKSEKLWKAILPLFGIFYRLWHLLLHIRGNGIVVVMRFHTTFFSQNP